MAKDIYHELADHIFGLELHPPREGLEVVLKENFTPLEAEVLLALPNNLMPLQPVEVDEIIDKANLPREELINRLEGLAQRGMVFSGRTKSGEKGYALLQRAFGFAQTFFWKGEKTPMAKKMADLLGNSFFSNKTLNETYGTPGTKPFQFIPINETIEPELQAVYSYPMLEKVVEKARVIAVAHCPCRMRAHLQDRGCDHLVEVCLKFDDMAEYLIEREIAREVTKEDALDIIKKSEEDGLVHFVDNALGDIKHNCNCCGCCCWALGPIRKRDVPRDRIMATYFIRKTNEDECIGCGECIEICPVDALTMGDELPIVDEEWCVGCGLCITRCQTSAIKLINKSTQVPPQNFIELHQKIQEEAQ